MGLLPFSSCAPVAEPPEGCGFLFATGEALLATATFGLVPFMPDPLGDCADTFHTYVSLGPPVAELFDALSIHLVNYGPDPRSDRHVAQVYGNPTEVFPLWAALWRVQLWENHYPALERDASGEIISAPTAEALHAVNEHIYRHGIAAYDAMSVAIHGGTRIPDLPQQVEKVTIGSMTPLPPQGVTAGWGWDVTTVVAWQ